MSSRSRLPPSAPLALLLAVYFAVHVVVRLVLPSTLEHDEAQQVFVSQFLALGYDGQPPLYNWLQTLVFDLFGVSRLALAALKNALLLATYLLVYATARQLLASRALAAVAALGLVTLPQLGFESQRDLTHTVAAFFSSALFVYALVRTIRRPGLPGYVLTGIAIGLCVMSKYNVLLLPLAACAAMLIERDFRRRVLDVRILATILVSGAIVLPHALWFAQNMEAATEGTIAKMTSETSDAVSLLFGFGSFLVAIFGCVALTLVCFTAAYRGNLLAAARAGTPWTRFFERMAGFLALALLLIIVAGGVDSIRDRWISPYSVVFPLYLCLKIEAAGKNDAGAQRRIVRIAALFMTAIPVLLLLRIMTAGLTGEYQHINAPFEGLMRDIARHAPTPSLFVTQETHVAGNLHLQRPDVAAFAETYPHFVPPFAWTKEHPAVLVWRERKGGTPPPVPEDLTAWMERNGGPIGRIESHTVSLSYLYGAPGDTYQFGYAVAYPR